VTIASPQTKAVATLPPRLIATTSRSVAGLHEFAHQLADGSHEVIEGLVVQQPFAIGLVAELGVVIAGDQDEADDLVVGDAQVEMYIQPPLPGKLQAGELLREPHEDGDRWSLVLTPSCDLEWNKAELILLASGRSIEAHPRVIAWRGGEGNAKQKRKAQAELHELLRQATGGQLDRWLYLPAAVAHP
jgi:hypothetical protein